MRTKIKRAINRDGCSASIYCILLFSVDIKKFIIFQSILCVIYRVLNHETAQIMVLEMMHYTVYTVNTLYS